MSAQKILIIKLGYSETFDKEISEFTSLGDVLRSTVLLHHYKNDKVTWLTDAKAIPLLYNNPCIHKVLPYTLSSILQLEAEHFDVVVNLEKVPGICALTDKIHAWQKFGYRFNVLTGEAEAYLKAEQALRLSLDDAHKKSHGRTWQQSLYDIIDAKWEGENYILGYQSTSQVKNDIGFNIEVGNKFKTKAWPLDKWTNLKQMLPEFSISYQEGKSNLYEYIDWIHSCQLIITNDSLGLHIAIALNKKFIALFGPTSSFEVESYGLGTFLSAKDIPYPCMPCYSPECSNDTFCMNQIRVDEVAHEARRILKKAN